MNQAAQNLIDAFFELPVSERHAVIIELARISETDADAFSDEELIQAADQLFSIYDAEEADHGETSAG